MAFGEQVVVLKENGLFMLRRWAVGTGQFSRSGDECSGVFHILPKRTFSEKKVMT